MNVQPHEPVSGWYILDGRDPVTFERENFWPFTSKDYWEVPSVGTCRVTLANNQKIIVRALSEERKAARLFRTAHKLGVMRSQEEMDQMSHDFEYARVNAESGVFR